MVDVFDFHIGKVVDNLDLKVGEGFNHLPLATLLGVMFDHFDLEVLEIFDHLHFDVGKIFDKLHLSRQLFPIK